VNSFEEFNLLAMAMAAAEARKGPTQFELQVAAGLAAMPTEVKLELDTPGATAYKALIEGQIEALKEAEAKLTGKDNKKARTEKAKEIAALKADKKFIDAERVVKGTDPANGNFILSKTGGEVAKKEEVVTETKKEEKKEKPKKGKEGGISAEEKDELEKLKNDIVARKTQLKADGLSGGQQNKDAEIVKWVARMNELKEKQEPGSTAKKPEESKKKKGKLSADDQLEFDGLRQKIEAYKTQCTTEFGMTKKDLKVDPDLLDMEKQLAEFEKRAK